MKLFVDTSPFIYLVESHAFYAEKVQGLLLSSITKNDELVTSVISWMEFSVMPQKTNRLDLIEKYQDLLAQLGVSLLEISLGIANQVALMRSNYDFLKPMDPLQLAVAIDSGCAQFITNDKDLRRITEIKVMTHDQL